MVLGQWIQYSVYNMQMVLLCFVSLWFWFKLFLNSHDEFTRIRKGCFNDTIVWLSKCQWDMVKNDPYQTKPKTLNTLRLRQNCHHFTDDILQCIFLDANVWTWLKISLKFVPKIRINNISALAQIMAWHQPGDKPLSEPMIVSFSDA